MPIQKTDYHGKAYALLGIEALTIIGSYVGTTFWYCSGAAQFMHDVVSTYFDRGVAFMDQAFLYTPTLQHTPYVILGTNAVLFSLYARGKWEDNRKKIAEKTKESKQFVQKKIEEAKILVHDSREKLVQTSIASFSDAQSWTKETIKSSPKNLMKHASNVGSEMGRDISDITYYYFLNPLSDAGDAFGIHANRALDRHEAYLVKRNAFIKKYLGKGNQFVDDVKADVDTTKEFASRQYFATIFTLDDHLDATMQPVISKAVEYKNAVAHNLTQAGKQLSSATENSRKFLSTIIARYTVFKL